MMLISQGRSSVTGGTDKGCVASHVTACAELDHLHPIPESYP